MGVNFFSQNWTRRGGGVRGLRAPGCKKSRSSFLNISLRNSFFCNREWFHILVLHQNRAKRGPTSFIPESFIPDFFHLVIWGHEHDCRSLLKFVAISMLTCKYVSHRIVPEASDKDFFITQPGSPCATSLCEGEAIQKAVGVLNIRLALAWPMFHII